MRIYGKKYQDILYFSLFMLTIYIVSYCHLNQMERDCNVALSFEVEYVLDFPTSSTATTSQADNAIRRFGVFDAMLCWTDLPQTCLCMLIIFFSDTSCTVAVGYCVQLLFVPNLAPSFSSSRVEESSAAMSLIKMDGT